MNKTASLIIGIILVALGALSLVGNFLLTSGALSLSSAYQLWPVMVIGAGLLFVLPPFFFRSIRGLSGLFVPGFPILTSGLILLACSLTGNYGLWVVLWPLEVISFGLAFFAMAWFMDVIWLVIPGCLFSLLGLALQFSAYTAQWAAWAILWLVIPFSLGVAFIIIGMMDRHPVLTVVGAGFCAFVGVAFAGVTALGQSYELLSLLVPVFVIGLGVIIIVLGLRPDRKQEQVEASAMDAAEIPQSAE